MGQYTIELTEENFDETVANGVVLVDFWADWCGPCKALAPTLEQVAEEMQGKATVAKVNVDECETLSRRFGIMSIPTLYLFKNGEPVDKTFGIRPKAAILQMIEKAL